MKGATRQALLFLLLSFVWGTAFVAISAGLEDLPPVLFAAFRYDVAGLIMLGYVIVAGKDWWPTDLADWAVVAVGSILIITAYNALLFIGQQEVSSGAAAIIIATIPILSTVFARGLLPEDRLTPVGTLGLVLGFVGVGLVAAPDPSQLFSDAGIAAGLIFLAAVATAFGSVVTQRLQTSLSPEGIVAWSCVLGAIMLHLVSIGLPSESLDQAVFTPTAIVAVTFLAIFASAIGYFIYFDLLERVGAIQINLVSYAVPVFATSFGWLLLDEVVTLTTIAGFLTIFVGFLLIKRRSIARQLSGTHLPRLP